MAWCLLSAILAHGVAAQPAWLDSAIGEPDPNVVPAPWTAIARDGDLVQVVGRTIGLESGPLPSSLTSAGEPLLAAPVQLNAATPDGALTWAWQRDALDLGPATTTWHGVGEARGWRAEVAGRLDYDGLIQLALAVTPPAGGGTLNSLTFELPLVPARALHFSYWPGKWGTASNSGALPPDGLLLPFKPVLWLGDNDRGISLCAETDQGWHPADANRALEVRPGDPVRVVAHLLDQPTPLTAPWHTVLMLHPTPIKPLPADPHALHINHGGSYGLETRPATGPSATVTYRADQVLDAAQGTLEAWVAPVFDPQRELRPEEVAGRGAFNRELFMVRLANGWTAGFYWNIDDRGLRYYVRRGKQDDVPIVVGGRNPGRADEVHQVALTWGAAIRVWYDGKLVNEQAWQGLFGEPVDLAGATFEVGGAPCEFALSALRTERTARTEFQPDGPPERTPETLLLEVGADLGKAGRLHGVGHGEGRFGPSLLLYHPGLMHQTGLDALQQAGVRTLIFHEHWTDIQDYGDTTHGAELEALADACHARGMKLAVYFGYELSDINPDWDAWHERCLVAPRAGGYKRQPPQTAYIVCYHSPWQNYTLEGIANVVDKYGVDGVYLDGTIEPFGCANELHGCGYVGDDGKRRQTYPILAVRRLMQRMYTLLGQRRKDVIIDAHQSLCMMTPTLSWCSGYWDGEQLTSSYEEGRQPLEYLPLATFRAEFMGRQYGVPAMFLNYSGKPFQPAEALTFALLHDVLPRGSGVNDVQQLVTPIWRALDDFGRAEARFVGYWDSAPYATVTPEAAKVSVYAKPGRTLLVVANLDHAPQQVTVTLGPDAGRGRLTARDVLQNEPVAVNGRTMAFELGRLGLRLIEVTAGE